MQVTLTTTREILIYDNASDSYLRQRKWLLATTMKGALSYDNASDLSTTMQGALSYDNTSDSYYNARDSLLQQYTVTIVFLPRNLFNDFPHGVDCTTSNGRTTKNNEL